MRDSEGARDAMILGAFGVAVVLAGGVLGLLLIARAGFNLAASFVRRPLRRAGTP